MSMKYEFKRSIKEKTQRLLNKKDNKIIKALIDSKDKYFSRKNQNLQNGL